MDTFLVLEAFSLVPQYVISSVNEIKFRTHHTCKCACHDQCKLHRKRAVHRFINADYKRRPGKLLVVRGSTAECMT